MSDILIVDDERDIRELISDILEDEGYATRLAENSNEAMSAINAEPPALLILDIWLKDSRMDGIDILKAVKRDNPDVPVVIISGHGNVEIAVAAIKQGAYDFIEKGSRTVAWMASTFLRPSSVIIRTSLWLSSQGMEMSKSRSLQ